MYYMWSWIERKTDVNVVKSLLRERYHSMSQPRTPNIQKIHNHNAAV